MTRKLRNTTWPEAPCDTYAVAPHRYLYTGGEGTESDPYAPSHAAWKASVPYKEGEVVYVEVGGQAKRVLIIHVLRDRDRFDDPREKYRGLLETKKGYWAKQFTDWYPGYVQRGYQRAGLAPEMPAN
jgi:hypothetical protein